MLQTGIGLLGPFHSRAGWLDVDHNRASSFAVVTAEFLVQQNIMMGFFAECVPMTSASLRFNSEPVHICRKIEGLLGVKQLVECKVITMRLISINKFLQLHRTKLLAEVLSMCRKVLASGITT